MFNDKPYSSVNREERFFCSLFAHALLSSQQFRRRVVELVAGRLGVVLDARSLHVYIETAALRDYWHDLGDSVKYDATTHERRRAVLDAVLQMVDVDPRVVDATPLFWTSGPGSKLWYPGRWSKPQLQAAGLGQLSQVCWAFNAKPDMLLLSPNNALLVEAKVESGEGTSNAGYDQLATQQLIARLWRTLIPHFAAVPIHLTTLKLRRDAQGISWRDVLECLDGVEIDDFTTTSFRRLVKYSQ